MYTTPVENILAEQRHRPWPLPAGPWIGRQTWYDLLFAHWPIPVSTLRALVPPELELDTYEGMAWVGVVPFRMSHVRPRWLPSLPWLSFFPELNVRTYVKVPTVQTPDADIHIASEAQTKPGVYFFSLDAGNRLAVSIARRVFLLPYFHARMECREEQQSTIRYTSHRTHKGSQPAALEGTYGATGGISHARPGTLDHWLTERYCLYTVDQERRLYRAEIHHLPWPLQPATAEFQSNTMVSAAGMVLPRTEPLLHFSRRQDVYVWPLERVQQRAL